MKFWTGFKQGSLAATDLLTLLIKEQGGWAKAQPPIRKKSCLSLNWLVQPFEQCKLLSFKTNLERLIYPMSPKKPLVTSIPLILALFAIAGCDQLEQKVDAGTCADPAVTEGIKDLIFLDARQNFPGEVRFVNDLEGQLSFSLASPTTSAVDTEVSRVDCEARATLMVSPGVQEHFARKETLIADIGYSIQDTADGSERVYRAGGTRPLVSAVLSAAGSLASEEAPMPATNRASAPEPAIARSGADAPAGSCQALWLERNTIFADAGYCFKSKRGVEAFGKNCFEPFGKLSAADQRRVDEIKKRERAKGCK